MHAKSTTTKMDCGPTCQQLGLWEEHSGTQGWQVGLIWRGTKLGGVGLLLRLQGTREPFKERMSPELAPMMSAPPRGIEHIGSTRGHEKKIKGKGKLLKTGDAKVLLRSAWSSILRPTLQNRLRDRDFGLVVGSQPIGVEDRQILLRQKELLYLEEAIMEVCLWVFISFQLKLIPLH